jgi:crossover junction endodeoxyribonuclease RuvC
VIESVAGSLKYVASGVIKSQADEPLPLRLKTLFEGVSEVVRQYQPHLAAVEIVFVNVNPQSTLLLGQARGAAISALVHAGLPVAEYTALQIKQAVVGKGHANKEQVMSMVKRLLALPAEPGSDAADALACAIRHAHGQSPAPTLPLSGLKVRRGRLVSA